MSNVKFTQLPNLGNITPTTIVPVVAANVNYTVTAANLQTYVNSTTGNITAGNISATGNITGSYILGNGSQLTGLPQQYGNANVAAYLPTYTGNLAGNNINITTLATFGDMTIGAGKTIDMGNNIVGNVASPLASNDAATKDYVDTSVSAVALAISDGVVTEAILNGDTILFQGVANETTVTVSAPDTVTIGLPSNVTIAGTLAANAITSNTTISATGNITGNKFFGDGSALTGIIANVALQGNLQGNLVGNGFGANALTFVSATGNVTASNLVTAGNVTANYVKGNGSELTGIVNSILAGTGISISAATGNVTITNNNPTPYANANVANFMAAFGSNVISTTGNITAGNIAATGRISATGNVQGAFLLGNASSATGIPTSIAAGTGISVNAGTGAVTVTNSGVTGLTAGSGISLSGSTGNVTITATGGGGGTNIQNGTSSVSIPSTNGNIFFNVNGTQRMLMTDLGVGFGGTQLNSGMIIGDAGNSHILQVWGNTTLATNAGTRVNFGSSYLTAAGGMTVAGAAQFNSSTGLAGTTTVTGVFLQNLSTKQNNSTGSIGQIAWDANYIYVCTATNTWKRVALSTF